MAIEETRQAVSPTNTPRPFPHPTNLILGCAFAGTLLFWWVLVHLLVAAFPGQDNWALQVLAAILAAMIRTLAGVVVRARQVAEWAVLRRHGRSAKPRPACGRASGEPAGAAGPSAVTWRPRGREGP